MSVPISSSNKTALVSESINTWTLTHSVDAVAIQAQALLLEQSLMSEGSKIPNWTSPQTPVGGYDDCQVVSTFGPLPVFDFEAKDHLALVEQHGLAEFESAATARYASLHCPLLTP